ncbi:flagellar biosynthetic protein FliR [Nevskia soli]|uniref:flagellar biosynthetic protein FliR n=1 Tax=Nevskia soli TaxID=418856 RepID=UPI0004A705EA|nr:flagellar biosynthetic protein FliR [Nevskia soli]
MDLTLDAGWLIGLLLIATRLAGLFLLSPVLGFGVVPSRIQLVFVFALALIFATSLGAVSVQVTTLVQLVRLAMVELARGALLALSVNAAFAALNLAGQLMDFQIGFNASAVFNFNTQSQDPVISSMFAMLGGVLFLVFDAHHELLRGLAQSFQVEPVGDLALALDAHRLAAQLGGVFLYGFMVASPVVMGLFLFDVATAFISRSMPQLNIYFVSLPVKIFWGLTLLVTSLTQVGPLIRAIFAHGALRFGVAV